MAKINPVDAVGMRSWVATPPSPLLEESSCPGLHPLPSPAPWYHRQFVVTSCYCNAVTISSDIKQKILKKTEHFFYRVMTGQLIYLSDINGYIEPAADTVFNIFHMSD